MWPTRQPASAGTKPRKSRPRAAAIGANWGGIRARVASLGYLTGTGSRATATGAYWGQLRHSRAETRPRATAIGATWGGIRARIGYQTGTSLRATAIGGNWGNFRARPPKTSRDRWSQRGVHK